jgi:DNA invertase Pin-like site-specific DNA recombinase
MDDKKIVRACIYARCSTDENKQDVEVQLIQLRQYCEAYGWDYTEVAEYGSGYKGCQPKLDQLLEDIKEKRFNVLVVYSMDRFSRESPSKINALLDTIVEKHGCRFLALQQGIDSDNELTWAVCKPLFVYFANKYSRDLGQKVRLGIAQKKAKGVYRGGRPRKSVNLAIIEDLRSKGLTLRAIAQEINFNKSQQEKISYSSVQRLVSKTGVNHG